MTDQKLHLGMSALLVSLIAWLLFGLGAMPGSAKAAGTAKRSAVGAGRQLFRANCSPCHGTTGAGGVKIGEATSADLRQASLKPIYHNNARLLRRAILDGKDEEGGNLDRAMPRWEGKLARRQVDDIIAYLETLK